MSKDAGSSCRKLDRVAATTWAVLCPVRNSTITASPVSSSATRGVVEKGPLRWSITPYCWYSIVSAAVAAFVLRNLLALSTAGRARAFPAPAAGAMCRVVLAADVHEGEREPSSTRDAARACTFDSFAAERWYWGFRLVTYPRWRPRDDVTDLRTASGDVTDPRSLSSQ